MLCYNSQVILLIVVSLYYRLGELHDRNAVPSVGSPLITLELPRLIGLSELNLISLELNVQVYSVLSKRLNEIVYAWIKGKVYVQDLYSNIIIGTCMYQRRSIVTY